MATYSIAQPPLEFQQLWTVVLTWFDAAHAGTDGGGVLLKALDDCLQLTDYLVACLSDRRDPGKVQYAGEHNWDILNLSERSRSI